MAQPIPVLTAQQQTADWRDFINPIAGNAIVHSFFIPKEDIDAVYKYAETGIRVYGALRIANDPTSLHLLVVGVDANGDDVIEDGGDSIIYDTTQPCPNMCGGVSILNGQI
jgi:hypothetical protein